RFWFGGSVYSVGLLGQIHPDGTNRTVGPSRQIERLRIIPLLKILVGTVGISRIMGDPLYFHCPFGTGVLPTADSSRIGYDKSVVGSVAANYALPFVDLDPFNLLFRGCIHHIRHD